MNTEPIRRALRALLPLPASAPVSISLQHLGFDGVDLDALPPVLVEAGRELGAALVLVGNGGDVVLAERGFMARVAPQVLHAFLEARPLVVVGAAVAERDAGRTRDELVRQLRPIVRSFEADAPEPGQSTLPPAQGTDPGFDSGFDSAFDSRLHADRLAGLELDADRAELLNRLRRGLTDPLQPPLLAGYGPHASLAIDFGLGRVRIDELADQRLRVARELPLPVNGAEPGLRSRTRNLESVAWDLAFAAGEYRLLHAPVNWWRASLAVRPGFGVERFSMQPAHLALARGLAAGPVTPADLRRRARVDLRELRGFVQACLFLGIARWLPAR